MTLRIGREATGAGGARTSCHDLASRASAPSWRSSKEAKSTCGRYKKGGLALDSLSSTGPVTFRCLILLRAPAAMT